MNIEHLHLSQLIPFAENPRKVTDQDRSKLRASILKFGLFKPLLVWRGTDHPKGITGPIVIGGNQRLHNLRALQEGGSLPIQITLSQGVVEVREDAIPCVFFPGSWAEAQVVALRDNTQEGEWDWDKLPEYVSSLGALFPEGEWDPALTGFDAQILADLEAIGSDPALFSEPPPEPQETPQDTKKGDGKGKEKGAEESSSEGTSFLTRQGARVVVGNIRGKIPVALYERWAALIQHYSGKLNTTDLSAIMDRIAGDLEKKTRR